MTTKKKPLFTPSKHKKKIIVLSVGAIVVLWNFVAIPVAATNGLTLPPVTIDHLRTASMLLLGL